MRIKIKFGACRLSGKYLGKNCRRRQYTEQVLLCNLRAFKIASEKLNKHVDIQKPALNFKSARIFDIRQKASLSRNIVDYLNIPGFSSDIEFLNEMGYLYECSIPLRKLWNWQILGGEEEWTATDVEGFTKPVDTCLRSRRGEKF